MRTAKDLKLVVWHVDVIHKTFFGDTLYTMCSTY